MRVVRAIAFSSLAVAAAIVAAPYASTKPTLQIEDYLVMPITGIIEGKTTNEVLLSRVNTIREEVGGADRLFITDMNGPLYLLDKASKKLTVYLDFNRNKGKTGIFEKLTIVVGYGNGLNGFYLDPEYRRNGKFYTVHMEDPAFPGSNLPNNSSFPGFDVSGYTTTEPIKTPGPTVTEGVLVEWTDRTPGNATFEGTARELLRIQLNTRSHPIGDLLFNPTARPGDPDWRVLYLECGDGASGESKNLAMRWNPQRLDNLEGKIVRIIPDLALHTATSRVSENGRYRIPNDNPFVSTAGARPEIWAYGLRNPHRLAWGVDPANPANNRLIANSVGLRTWEAVYLIHKGGNYGYPRREGTQVLNQDNTLGPLPEDDRIPLQIGDTPTDKLIVPLYPVIQYGHDMAAGGDAIGSGFVYDGTAIPALRGKYIFTDLTTGRIWYAAYRDMLAADDGKPQTLAPITEVRVEWNKKAFDTMFPIVLETYHARGGKSPLLPTPQEVATRGRADVRFAVDAAGELYLYSKGDGVIRKVVGASGF